MSIVLMLRFSKTESLTRTTQKNYKTEIGGLKCMEWVIFEILDELQRSYEHKAVMEEFERITEHLVVLEGKLDQEVMIRVRAGLNHLRAYESSDIPDVKKDELRMASEKFSELMALEPMLSTSDIPNEVLICFGYWGEHLYFSLRGDMKNAALLAYECIQIWPKCGLNMFPSNILNRNYRDLISDISAGIESTAKQLEEIESDVYWKNVWVYTKAGIAGFGAGALAGIFTAGTTSVVVGYLTAKQVLEEAGDTTSLEQIALAGKLIELSDRYENTLKELVEECGTRIREIKMMRFR